KSTSSAITQTPIPPCTMDFASLRAASRRKPGFIPLSLIGYKIAPFPVNHGLTLRKSGYEGKATVSVPAQLEAVCCGARLRKVTPILVNIVGCADVKKSS